MYISYILLELFSEEDFEVPQNNFIDLLWKQTSILFKNSLGTDKDATYGSGAYSYFWHIPRESHSTHFYPHLMQFGDVITQTVSCEMDFTLFPFDHHSCDMIFYLTQHPSDYVMFDSPMVFKGQNNVSIGEESMNIPTKRLPYTISVESLNTSIVYTLNRKRSATGVRFHFARNSIGLLLGGYYLPTGIFASLSLVSFIIKPEIVPGRMGLLVTLFLISTNVYGQVDAPKGRGFSLIELWMLGTNFPILAAIVEYGYVLVLQSRKIASMCGNEEVDGLIYLKKVDNFAFILSFVYQIFFVCIYWIIAHSL